MPAWLRLIATLEATGRVDRTVDGLATDDVFQLRAADGRGFTRPELAILLSQGKLALQAAIEAGEVAGDALLRPMLHAAFPPAIGTAGWSAFGRWSIRPARRRCPPPRCWPSLPAGRACSWPAEPFRRSACPTRLVT